MFFSFRVRTTHSSNFVSSAKLTVLMGIKFRSAWACKDGFFKKKILLSRLNNIVGLKKSRK